MKALLEAEARLGVTFPEAYRQFISERKQHHVAVKQVEFFPIARCHWLTDEAAGKAVVIGRSFADTAGVLCLRPDSKGKLGEAVYEWAGARFVRRPDFSDFVSREKPTLAASADGRVAFAERLAGLRRTCGRCASEILVAQTCQCGHIGEGGDEKFVLSPEQLAQSQTEHPTVWSAWQILSELKRAGLGVPAGSIQVLALAELLGEHLEPAAVAQRMLEAWKKKGLKVAATQSAFVNAIVAVGAMARS